METSNNQIEDFIARRLISRAGENVKPKPTSRIDRTLNQQIQTEAEKQLSADFIKIEKNLTSLGFFTPSTKKIKHATEKVITFTKMIDGKKVEARATIVPSAKYGLPITADQDTYLAIFKIATEIQRENGVVSNPIGFTSAELLRIQGKSSVSGYHYKELSEQLLRIKTSTILSEGAVYLAKRKVWAKDAFNVFDRIVIFGMQLPDGTIAEKNYVWLSEWQLENINQNHLLPIDYDTYKRLKNHIAKALVPLLQIWLYASREEKSFEKRYEEICQILNIRQYQHVSKIKEKFGPSLDELKRFEYIADWKVEKTSDRKGYKLIFYHGDKFHRDRRQRLASKNGGALPKAEIESSHVELAEGVDPDLFLQVTKRGISAKQAEKLLLNLAENQHIIDQLEWGDQLITQSEKGKFTNPPGFYVHLIRENVTPPDTFVSTRKQRLIDGAREARQQVEEESARLQLAYDDYCSEEIDRYIAENFDGIIFDEVIDQKKKELLASGNKLFQQWQAYHPDTLTSFAERQVRSDISKRISFTNFETFCAEQRATTNQVKAVAAGVTSTMQPLIFAIDLMQKQLPPPGQGSGTSQPVSQIDDDLDEDDYLTV